LGNSRHDGQIRTNIRRITKAITQKITGWGYDVYISYSGRTKSRYFEFKLRDRRRIKIRLSDHPSKRRWRYDYDVYTEEPRKHAMNYEELLKVLEVRTKLEGER
jgi:hypothetical protein